MTRFLFQETKSAVKFCGNTWRNNTFAEAGEFSSFPFTATESCLQVQKGCLITDAGLSAEALVQGDMTSHSKQVYAKNGDQRKLQMGNQCWHAYMSCPCNAVPMLTHSYLSQYYHIFSLPTWLSKHCELHKKMQGGAAEALSTDITFLTCHFFTFHEGAASVRALSITCTTFFYKPVLVSALGRWVHHYVTKHWHTLFLQLLQLHM